MARKNGKTDVFLRAARAAVRKVGWNPRVDLEVREVKHGEGTGSRQYGQHGGRVRLTRPADLEERLAGLAGELAGASKGDMQRGVEAVATARVLMSAGGYQICPFSAYDYAGILEAVADGLRSGSLPEPVVAEFTEGVASFFIGSVVAAVNAVAGADPRAFRRGWLLDQLISVPADASLPAHASVYSNIQLRLWCDDASAARALRDRFAKPFDALDFETERGVAILLDTFALAGEERDGLAWGEKQTADRIVEGLKYGWRSWPIKAFQFAELLASYVGMDEKRPPGPQQTQPGVGHSAGSSVRERGQGRSGRPSQDAEMRRANVQAQGCPPIRAQVEQGEVHAQQLAGAPIDSFRQRFNQDREFRRRVLASGVGRGVSPLRFQVGFEALDALYRERTSNVELKSESVVRKGMAFPVAHMARERLENGIPTLNDVDWGATRFGVDGELEIYRKSIPICHDTPGIEAVQGFPDLALIVDSSGSMGWDPNAGAGPYDSLLRAVYSMLQFLEQKQKAYHMKFSVLNFSGMTLSSGWQSYSELRQTKEMLFRYQGGGTIFDGSSLESLIRESNDRFLAVMVTDGQIGNAGEVAETVRGLLSKGHGFVLIQIGKQSAFGELLRKLGVATHVISDHRQLEGLYVEWAQAVWGKGVNS